MHSSINLVASVRGWQVPLPYKAQTTLWVQCLIKRSSVPSPFKLHQVLTRLFQSCYSHRFALLEPACSSKHGKAATSHFITLLKLDQFLDENLWLDFNLFTKQLVPGSLLCARAVFLGAGDPTEESSWPHRAYVLLGNDRKQTRNHLYIT